MTTSGTYVYTQNRGQIIRRAARLVGAISAGETPSASINQDFSDALNAMTKRWQATGLHLWAEQEGILFLQPNQKMYVLGSPTTDHATQVYAQTTTNTVASLGATTISVASIVNIVNGYNLGIVLASGAMFWTTVNGTPSGSTVTLAAPLTGAVNSSAVVVAYQTAIQRPLRIINSRRYNFASGLDIPMNPALSRLDYRELPNKDATGTPTQFFYDPQIPAGNIYIWPTENIVVDAIKFTWMRELQDFATDANTPDFPQEWLDTLIYNLAFSMAPEFGVPQEQYAMIKEQAALYLDLAMGFDREPESIYFQLDTARMGR